jgi:hypothetical protein
MARLGSDHIPILIQVALIFPNVISSDLSNTGLNLMDSNRWLKVIGSIRGYSKTVHRIW